MRKALYVFPIVAAAVLATPALAQPYGYDPQYNPDAPAATVTGAAVGTAAGVAIYNGALGSGADLPTAARCRPRQPCAAAGRRCCRRRHDCLGRRGGAAVRGFQALFLMHREECANAEWGNAPRRRIAQR